MDGKVKERLQGLGVIFSLVASTYAGFMVISGKLERVLIDSDMQEHDRSISAHPPLRGDIYDCKDMASKLAKALDDEHKSTIAMSSHLIRIIAADREPNRALRAASATYYEQEFIRLVNKGETIESAFLISLRTPWYTKPR